MARQHRPERLASLLTEIVSELLQREMKDPRLGFASVTHVDVSADLRVVKVYVSVLGSEAEQQETFRVLRGATGFVRSMVGEQVRLRFTPELHFLLDKSLEQGDRVLRLMKQLAAQESGSPAPEQAG